jgi:hypothetical protein
MAERKNLQRNRKNEKQGEYMDIIKNIMENNG